MRIHELTKPITKLLLNYLYHPQLVHALCGNFRLWHFGHVTRDGNFKLIDAFLVLLLALACFFLGNGVIFVKFP